MKVKSRKTKENGISHLRETALIHQTGEILTSKLTFIQGVSEKLLKKRGTQIASCAHIYLAFQHSLNWKSTTQCSPFLASFWDTLYLSLIKPIHGQNVQHNHSLCSKVGVGNHNPVKTSNINKLGATPQIFCKVCMIAEPKN